MEKEGVKITMNGCQVITGNIGSMNVLFCGGGMESSATKEDAGEAEKEGMSFATRPQANLQGLKAYMEKAGLIAEGMRQAEFNKAFTGKEVTQKIEWRGKQLVLAAFVKEAMDQGVLKCKEKRWETAARCFTMRGEEIAANNLKSKTEVKGREDITMVNTMVSYL